MTSAKQIGDFSELFVATYFTKKGYFVSKPMTDTAPYDLVVDMGNRLIKVQVKYRNRTKENKIKVGFDDCPSHKLYKDGDFDYLVVQDGETNKLAMISWEEVRHLKSVTFTIDPPLKPNKNIRHFDDYLLS